MNIDLYTQTGEKKGTVELPAEIFETPYNKDLIHQALVRQLANKRTPIAHTKTRAEISGGGRKPFRQKGTGRARQGTIRAPQMRGGGVVFGPRNTRNFEKNMPKKQRRKALFSALSLKAKNEEIIGLEEFSVQTPSTKSFAEMMKKLPIERNALFVLPEKNKIIEKSASNLKSAKTILANYVNIADLQKYKKIVFLNGSIAKLEETFLK